MGTPFIEIFGLHISEPMTLVTDYMIAVMGFYYWRVLFDIDKRQKNTAKISWAFCFLFLGFGAFLGGTYHGFSAYLNSFLDQAIWKITVYSIGIVSFLFVVGTAKGFFDPKTARFWSWFAGVKLILYWFWMISHSDFLYLIIDYIPSLVAVLVFSITAFLNDKHLSAPWLAAGVIVSFFGAGIQVAELSPHEFFNHNDFYHVIQMGALYLFFRGARNL